MPAIKFNQYLAMTLSDQTDHPFVTDAVYVGVGGNIAFVREDNTVVVFKGAVTGSILPIKCKRVNTASTTATDLVGLRQL